MAFTSFSGRFPVAVNFISPESWEHVHQKQGHIEHGNTANKVFREGIEMHRTIGLDGIEQDPCHFIGRIAIKFRDRLIVGVGGRLVFIRPSGERG